MTEHKALQANWPYRLLIDDSGLHLSFVTLGSDGQLNTAWQPTLDARYGPLQAHYFATPSICMVVQRLGRVCAFDVVSQRCLYEHLFETDSAVQVARTSSTLPTCYIAYSFQGRTQLRGLRMEEGDIVHTADLPGYLFNGQLQCTATDLLLLYTQGQHRQDGKRSWYHGYHWVSPIEQTFSSTCMLLAHPPRFHLGARQPPYREDLAIGILPYRPLPGSTTGRHSSGPRLHVFWAEGQRETTRRARDIPLCPEPEDAGAFNGPGETLPWLLRPGMPVPAGTDDNDYGAPCDFNHQYNELEHWMAWSGGYVRRIETSGVLSPWVRLQTAEGKPLEQPRIRAVHAQGLFLQAQGLGFFLATEELNNTPTTETETGDLTCTPRLQPLTPGQLYFERTAH